MQLRDYQLDVIDELTTLAAVEGKRRLLLQAATGAGKTVIASKIVSNAVSTGNHVLFLAHRRELVNQCSEKLLKFGIEHGIIMAGDPWDSTQLVNVASVQTIHSWMIRRKKEAMPKADLVIIDECHHHSSSKTWQEILAAFPQSLVLGMTATPINKKGRGLGFYFESMVQCPNMATLIDQKFLVPVKYFVPSIPDLQGVKIQAGDYVEAQLQKRMDIPKLIGDICENWARICPDRRTLVFASGVKHSIHLAESFNALGIKADHVDGKTPTKERDEKIAKFTRGEIQVLCNCAVFTEGVDIPAASALVIARPTKSLGLYLQMGGRVLRPFEGKSNAIVLDHAGVVYEHGPIENDWQWFLDYNESNVSTVTKDKIKLKKEITCNQCKRVYWGKLCCPECGWKPTVKGKHVETYEAYLQALTEEYVTENIPRREWLAGLRGYALTHSYKPGWASHKYKEKFGCWPPNQWAGNPSSEPSIEIVAWIRKSQRDYVNAKMKEQLNQL